MLLNTNGISIIKALVEHGSEDSMNDLIEFSVKFKLSYKEIAELALGLAHSGNIIENNLKSELYDIPSTGGPGSLSTLLTPLVLSALGKKVLKLGVPGRPAGAIDCLAQINGYTIEPSLKELENWIDRGSYIHIIANKTFTPLDIAFFGHRKKTNNIGVPSLIVASILSKKIALGVTHVGLDVRISKFGNFGSDWNEARSNAHLFNNVASLLGINSRCFISNGFYPQQPYFGRGESLLALQKVFINQDCEDLKKHIHKCYSMGISLAGQDNYYKLILRKQLESEFADNIKLQNASFDSFLELVYGIEKKHVYEHKATQSGFLKINLEGIREAIVLIQNRYSDTRFPDPCGIILKKNAFDYITTGDILCTFRCPEKYYKDFREKVECCFEFAPVINLNNELEEII